MARTFLAASNQYLSVSGTLTMPISMSCWFKADDVTTQGRLITVQDMPTNLDLLGLWAAGTTGGDPLQAITYDGVTPYAAHTTSGYTAGVWTHAACVFSTTTFRYVYINGGSYGQDFTLSAPSPINTMYIAGAGNIGLFNGTIAEVAIWSGTGLLLVDVLQLAKGYSPLLVRPEGLYGYWPLIGRTSPEIDLINGNGMALGNAPGTASSPRIIYPSYPQVGLHFTPASAASPYMTTSPGLWGPL